MSGPDKDSVERFLHAPAGFMVAAKPDATDHELCPLYVRASDYDAAIKERDRFEASLAASGAAAAEEMTDWQVNDACMWFRHDFGLLPISEANHVRFVCREWHRAIGKATLPADAQAALDLALDEAFNEGIERSAEYTTDAQARADIRALKRQPGKGE